MSGFTENQAFEANGRSGSTDRIMTWQASRDMLPLVGLIARDITRAKCRLGQFHDEVATLDKRRLTLDWPQRQRRYQLDDEVASAQSEMRLFNAELDALGVTLLDSDTGLVGFPTLVNQRRAFFSWLPGEEDLLWWNYADEFVRRPVPEEWTQSEPTRIVRVRSRSRRK